MDTFIFPFVCANMNTNGKPVSDAPLVGLIGNSAAMRHVYRLTRLAARSNASALLLGETGTGKELIAAQLHQLSERSDGPFIRVNCGALTETLLASELFGHVKGSFTDAIKDRTGRFEAAHGGTILLDEINSTSTTLQMQLLRVLQEREFERVGDTETIRVDVRVVAASNCDLREEISAGRFREDLFWRLNVLPINLPPLRRRREDIHLLVKHFLKFYNESSKHPIPSIHKDAMEALVNYQWPGNVRELQNYIERCVVLAEGKELTTKLLPNCVVGDAQASQEVVFRPTDEKSLVREYVYSHLSKAESAAKDLHGRIVDPVEKELLSQLMETHTQIKAAERMGINRNTLSKKLREYGLDGKGKETAKSEPDAEDSGK